MKMIALATLSFAFLANTLTATEKPPPKPTLPKGTPAEQVQALIAQHDKAMASFRKLFEAAKSDEEQEKLEPLFPDPGPYAELLVEIAEKNPKDPIAAEALLWAFRNDLSAKAKAILMRDHLLHPKIGLLCVRLRRELGDVPRQALERVLAENADKDAQAHAAYALGYLLKSHAALARKVQKADAKELAEWEKNRGKAETAYLKNANADALQKRAEELLERVTKEKAYSEVKVEKPDGWVKLGDMAAQELFEMRHLQPGQAAPEIIGEDIDGKPMKLSDFRGKVILLDFWGFW